jgi:hypothetical protein
MNKTKCTKKQLEALARGREKRAKNIRLNNRLKNQLGGRPVMVNYLLVKKNLDSLPGAQQRGSLSRAQHLAIYAIAAAICNKRSAEELIAASSGLSQFRQPSQRDMKGRGDTSLTYQKLAQAYHLARGTQPLSNQWKRFAYLLNSKCNSP